MKSVLLLVGVALGLVWSAVGGETIPVHDGEGPSGTLSFG